MILVAVINFPFDACTISIVNGNKSWIDAEISTPCLNNEEMQTSMRLPNSEA